MWSRVIGKATHRRIKEGRMIEFSRLSLIPKARKQGQVPDLIWTYGRAHHRDDYLLCLASDNSSAGAGMKRLCSSTSSAFAVHNAHKKVTALFIATDWRERQCAYWAQDHAWPA